MQHRGDHQQEAQGGAVGRGAAGEGGAGGAAVERDGGQPDPHGAGQLGPGDPSGHGGNDRQHQLEGTQRRPRHLHHHRQRGLQPSDHHSGLRDERSHGGGQIHQGARGVRRHQHLVHLGLHLDVAGGQVHYSGTDRRLGSLAHPGLSAALRHHLLLHRQGLGLPQQEEGGGRGDAAGKRGKFC